jgi:glycerol-1-phosphate dehydrogenase [NAD(P)+]
VFENVAIFTGNFGERYLEEKNLKSQFHKLKLYNLKKNNFSLEISSLKTEVIDQMPDLILSFGGGSINDIGKYISLQTGIPSIFVPTVISNDGILSPISIIREDDGYRSLGASSPIGVIGDIDILRKSPILYTLSGVGDLLSDISAVIDWGLSSNTAGEKIDFMARNIAWDASVSFLWSCENSKCNVIKDDNFLSDLFWGLILSGFTIIMAKSSRPASGSEHNISHALDKILGKNRKPHGLQVGFATLLCLKLQGRDDIMKRLKEFYKKIGFPTKFTELGIEKDTFIEAVKLAPKIRDRYTILNEVSEEKVIKAIDEIYEDV